MLFNGSATHNFSIGKGLRQGDPLSHFLFVLVEEALNNIMKKVAVFQNFRGFVANEEVYFDILQFADDTIILGEDSWTNLWSIKSILRGFELVSRLRVNFFKSNLYRVSVKNNFLQTTFVFISYCINKLPFKFLSVQVTSSSKRVRFWKNGIDYVSNRLSSWKGMGMSMEGMVFMINEVFKVIPSFMLSSYKALVKVLKEIIRI